VSDVKIFISYRRAAIASAARVYDHLCRRYSPQNLFMDVAGSSQESSIRAGADFREELRRHIAAADVVVCIITRAGGLATRERGDDTDYMQVEIAEAFRLTRRVVPVLVDGGMMPSADDLPQSIRQFPFLQAVELRHDRFDDDIRRLLTALSGEPWHQRRSVRLAAGATVLTTALLAWPVVTWLTRPVPYEGNRADVVVDPAGALMWGRVPVRKNIGLSDAVDSCRSSRLGGYADWRLPDSAELVVAHGMSAVWSRLTLEGLRGLWSSSTEGGINYAWVVYTNGETETLAVTNTAGLGAVCVRGFRKGEL
jgi:hypothetical protein